MFLVCRDARTHAAFGSCRCRASWTIWHRVARDRGCFVREIAPHDRPREKLVRLGAAGLGDNELLAVVLGNGARQTDALMVANAILEATGGLHGVARTGHDDLRRVHGVGAAKAAQVLAAIELGRRTLVRRPGQRKPFASPRELA